MQNAIEKNAKMNSVKNTKIEISDDDKIVMKNNAKHKIRRKKLRTGWQMRRIIMTAKMMENVKMMKKKNAKLRNTR